MLGLEETLTAYAVSTSIFKTAHPLKDLSMHQTQRGEK